MRFLLAVLTSLATLAATAATEHPKPGTQPAGSGQPANAGQPRIQPQPAPRRVVAQPKIERRPETRSVNAAAKKIEPKPGGGAAGKAPAAAKPSNATQARQRAEAERLRQQRATAARPKPPAKPRPAERPREVRPPQPERDRHYPDYARYYVRPYYRSSYPYVYNPYYGYVPYSGYAYSPYDYYGSYGYGSPYGSGYGMYSPYSSYAPYYDYPVYGYPAPIFLPADQLFGPGPIQRMLGVDQWFNRPAADAQAFAPGGGRAEPQLARRHDGDLAAGNVPAERGLNPKAAATAVKYITFGDAQFANQKYAEALSRYKTAAKFGPEVADAWFRQGFALAALGRYEQAVQAVDRGAGLRPDWANSDFTLDEIYGKDEVAKKARMDAMTRAAEENPNNGDLQYILAVHRYFDGQMQEAAPFFKRAGQLGVNRQLLKGFVKE